MTQVRRRVLRPAPARQIVAGKQNRTILVVLSPLVQIPVELEKLFVVVEHELPGREQSGIYQPNAVGSGTRRRVSRDSSNN